MKIGNLQLPAARRTHVRYPPRNEPSVGSPDCRFQILNFQFSIFNCGRSPTCRGGIREALVGDGRMGGRPSSFCPHRFASLLGGVEARPARQANGDRRMDEPPPAQPIRLSPFVCPPSHHAVTRRAIPGTSVRDNPASFSQINPLGRIILPSIVLHHSWNKIMRTK